MTRALDIDAVHGFGIAYPEAVVGGNMHHGVAAGESLREGLGLSEIADNGIAADAFKISEIAGFAHEEAEVSTLGSKSLSHMVSHKAGRACQKYPHGVNAILNGN